MVPGRQAACRALCGGGQKEVASPGSLRGLPPPGSVKYDSCMSTAAGQHLCDGCGETVAPEHVRDRIARLEWATRFRPIHINALLLAAAPPASLDDFFYGPAWPRQEGNWSDRFTRALLLSVAGTLQGTLKDAALANFQRHGLFLAYASECPRAGPDVPQLTGVLLRRILFSYRPKHVILLDGATHAMAADLSRALHGIPVVGCEAAAPAGDVAASAWEHFAASCRAALHRCTVSLPPVLP